MLNPKKYLSIGCGDYEISWSDSIDHLRWAYEDVKEEYGIEDEEAQTIDLLFEKLVKRLIKKRKSTVPWEELVFGRTYFEYLKNLLDLRNKEIRILLPYLLTAYTCNTRKNPFLFRGSTEGVIYTITFLPNPDLDSPPNSDLDYEKANKLVLSSKKLSQVFSLSQYHAESICSLNQNEHDHDGPEPLIWENVLHRARAKEVPVPLIRYKELAEKVFEFWISAINETAATAEVNGFPEDIDLEMCCALFNHYCANNGQNEPGK